MLQEESSFSDYQLIMELMNDSNFRTLFDRQFDDFSNIKSILVIMKTYAYLEKLYITQYGQKPSKEFMGKGIQNLMRNQNTRSCLAIGVSKPLELTPPPIGLLVYPTCFF